MLVYVMDNNGVPSNGYWAPVSTLLLAAGVTVTGTPLSELSAENAQLQQRIDELGKAHAKTNNALGEARDELERQRAHNADYERERDDFAAQCVQWEHRCANLRTEIDRLKAENATLVAARQESDKRLAKRDQEIAQLLATLESIRYNAASALA